MHAAWCSPERRHELAVEHRPDVHRHADLQEWVRGLRDAFHEPGRETVMSWRKGFFRVWVLLSIPYVVLTALYSYADIKWPLTDPRGFYYKSPFEPVSVDRYSAEFRDLESLKQSGEMLAIKISDMLPEITLFVPATIAATERDRRIDEVREILNRDVQLRRTSAIQYATAWALIPPAVLFVIGIGIAWAISGFRQKPS